MKYLKEDEGMNDADSIEDATTSTVRMEQQLEALEDSLRELPDSASALEKAEIELNISGLLVDLNRPEEGFAKARECFDIFLENENWESAAQACDIMFNADLDQSLAALGQGIWLAVTYPIDPELTVALLQHVVDETPDDSDGGALAATTARYIVDLRAEGKIKENLTFFTNNLLGTVARRHSNVENQQEFQLWIEKLELNDPGKFLVRLRNVVDVLVQDDWWFDREALQERLPVN
jgi:hypothetical protein